MSEQVEVKGDALPDLDDLLQCPVCYEIPTGQIFQCNEGHHVCGRCKMRLDVCPVCRALFFGTRNYAMEELIANVKKLRAFKLGGKVTTDSGTENNTPAKENITEVPENEIIGDDASEQSSQSTRPPQPCKGLFRCLSCKNSKGVRLPAARLLNHLRYFHSPELIEGQSENGEYVQAWQFSTAPGRIVTAVRVADMGIFFLIIEITSNNVCAWLSMAASPWVAHEFSYTVTISGNDREAIFSDCVWSVRSCEGSLKKRGHCLIVSGIDARALISPASINGKLSVRRTPPEQLATQTQPRAVLRVANRGNNREIAHPDDLEPYLQNLQHDVARLSRAFADLGREAEAIFVHNNEETQPRIENRNNINARERTSTSSVGNSPPTIENNQNNSGAESGEYVLSRNARRRMRQRIRAAINATQPPSDPAPRVVNIQQRQNRPMHNANMQHRHMAGLVIFQQPLVPLVGAPPRPPPVLPPVLPPPPVAPHSSTGTSNQPQSGNVRVNKKKRRHRR